MPPVSNTCPTMSVVHRDSGAHMVINSDEFDPTLHADTAEAVAEDELGAGKKNGRKKPPPTE